MVLVSDTRYGQEMGTLAVNWPCVFPALFSGYRLENYLLLFLTYLYISVKRLQMENLK